MASASQLSRSTNCRTADAHRILVQFQENLAVGIDPLGDLEAAVARHKGRRHFQEQIIEIIAGLAANLDRVAKALRREQPDGGSGALDDRVGNQGRAMHNAVQIRWPQPRLLKQAGDPGNDGCAGILGRGEQLADVDQLAGRVVQHEIREGAADINANPGCARFRSHAHSSP